VPQARIAIIGGTGLEEMEGLTHAQEVDMDTPFGKPSDAIVVGRLGDTAVAFLSRHGRGHRISPSELPARANIWALKSLGVERIISISAVGSLKEEIEPLHLVVPDQLIDRTRGRPSSFFGDGVVAHVGFADPFCPVLRQVLVEGCRSAGTTVHDGGTYVVMEGPQFSTRAESLLYRSWGASVIGMTALPEAKLAREAEICYATLACATDYDCWREGYESVSVELVMANLLKNVAVSKRVVQEVVPRIPRERACLCATALKNAIVTDPGRIPPSRKRELGLLIDKYLVS